MNLRTVVLPSLATQKKLSASTTYKEIHGKLKAILI